LSTETPLDTPNGNGDTPDTFARLNAKHAHLRLNKLETTVQNIDKRVPKRLPMFVGKCALCGHPCKANRRYCHAHQWAEGT
jgi:hypothetical protein